MQDPYGDYWSFLYPEGITKQGGTGMDPLTAMSLIKGGSTLVNTILSGILSGAGISQQRKYGEKIWKEKQAKLKPTQSFYLTPYLQGYDRVLAKAVLGNMGEKLGGRFGLDIPGLLQALKLNQPYGQSTPRLNQGKFSGLYPA